jgi:hypothetical protein
MAISWMSRCETADSDGKVIAGGAAVGVFSGRPGSVSAASVGLSVPTKPDETAALSALGAAWIPSRLALISFEESEHPGER